MTFAEAYKNLNPEQKKAVETIEGPVMVIAGPGTGKTQVLSLRIAHILESATQTKPDEILCLTFTNSGVKAMRERLLALIGPTATRVKISTFHAFGLELIEEYFEVLGFATAPRLLDDAATVALYNEVLFAREWQHVRPRNNPTQFYNDLKSLISTLKRDGISPVDLATATKLDIERINSDPDSISTRGASKGQLKKDASNKIESLTRTLEAAEFYQEYERIKKERNQIDYNDVLTAMVAIAIESEDAAAAIRERFQYVLIDEHQDSSGVQNAFLEAVWKGSERPNLFVVGDDRQLIYGFGGASLAYFESFKHTFGKATLITLTQNYRSTQTILDSAEALLQSSLAQDKLIGSTKHDYPLTLVTCDYPRDEIIAAGIQMKHYIEQGTDPNQCVILVPKNRHIKAVVPILRDIGLPVAAASTLSLFEIPATQTILNTLRILANPYDTVSIAASIIDPHLHIAPLIAYEYLHDSDPRTLSIATLLTAPQAAIRAWGDQLSEWMNVRHDVYELIQIIGDRVLVQTAPDDESIRERVEVIRTLLHLVLSHIEEGKPVNLREFVDYIDRLIEYGEQIPLAVFDAQQGIKVLTLHGSKGLEFDAVWIAHMDERSLMASRRGGFVLPRSIKETADEVAEETAKRQLYVAITRARYYCTISYARESHAGAHQTLATIIEALPGTVLQRTIFEQPEAIETSVRHSEHTALVQPQMLIDMVRDSYTTQKVSVTMLNNFFECPWKWYFRSLLQLPEKLTDSIHIGNITHKTIEYVLNKKTTDRSSEAIASYIRECSYIEARYDEKVAARFIQQVQPIVDVWMHRYYPTITAPYDTEKNITYHDPDFVHLTVMGKVDLIESVITGEARVTDWKTGTPKSTQEIEKIDEEGRMSPLLRQLAMYSYLIDAHSRGDLEVTESRLVFVEAAPDDTYALHTRRIMQDDIEALRSDIKDYDDSIKSGAWIQRPCRSRSIGECPYCAQAKRIYNL